MNGLKFTPRLKSILERLIIEDTLIISSEIYRKGYCVYLSKVPEEIEDVNF